MTRRSWLVLLFLAVIITFAIVFALNRGQASEAVVEREVEPVEESEPVEIVPTLEPEIIQLESIPVTPGQAPEATPATSSDVTGADYFVDCAFRTGGNAVIAFPNTLVQSGFSLEPGDEIAVVTTQGDICAGAGVWTGENIAITAWGDNGDTEAVEGMQEGEEMRFRIWDRSSGEVINISSATYIQGDGRYTVDGIYIIESLSGG